MADLRLDDCEHCACVTPLPGWTREQAIAALERGELGCWLCMEDADARAISGARHDTCVVLYDGDEAVWDGRCKR